MRLLSTNQKTSKIKIPSFKQGESPKSPKFKISSFRSPQSFQEPIIEQVHPYKKIIQEDTIMNQPIKEEPRKFTFPNFR